jgi:NAD(P)-dependent dehydrogenase (short-subunit alcohol dehydrogenase family)
MTRFVRDQGWSLSNLHGKQACRSALTISADVECGDSGIRVNAVSPGAIRTELLRDAFGPEKVVDSISGPHPLLRIGTREEVAETVLWLFSDSSL